MGIVLGARCPAAGLADRVSTLLARARRGGLAPRRDPRSACRTLDRSATGSPAPRTADRAGRPSSSRGTRSGRRPRGLRLLHGLRARDESTIAFVPLAALAILWRNKAATRRNAARSSGIQDYSGVPGARAGGSCPGRPAEWPEPVQRVADFLAPRRRRGSRSSAGARRPPRPRRRRRVSRPSQIVKSLVFVCDGRPVVALVPGDRRADGDKVARAVGAGRRGWPSPRRS